MEAARPTWVEGVGGVRLRLLHWPAPAGGRSVLLLPGRSEPVEKYGQAVDDLRRRDLDVWALDWRGQGLSQRSPGAEARGHVENFDLLAGDLAAVLARMDGRPLLLAHSMGAAVALRLCQMQPQTVRRLSGMVLSGPMIRLPTWGHRAWLVRLLARLNRLAGRGRCYVRGATDWAAEDHTFDGNRRTRSRSRFAREVALLRARPDLRVGGPTWGWLDAAFRLCDRLHGAWPAEALNVPLTVVAGADDPYVAETEQRRFFSRFPRARVCIVPGALHEVMMECDAARAAFWTAFDAAIQDCLGHAPGLSGRQDRLP